MCSVCRGVFEVLLENVQGIFELTKDGMKKRKHNIQNTIRGYTVKSVQSALSDLKRPPERLQSQCNYHSLLNSI